jgi:predicted RNA-binding protein with PUA-like domain
MWFMVDVHLTALWKTPLRLDQIRKAAVGAKEADEISLQIKDMVLLKSSRLSVQPLKRCEWEGIIALHDKVTVQADTEEEEPESASAGQVK